MTRSSPKVPKNPAIRQQRSRTLTCSKCPRSVVLVCSEDKEHWPEHRCYDGRPAAFDGWGELQQHAVWIDP